MKTLIKLILACCFITLLVFACFSLTGCTSTQPDSHQIPASAAFAQQPTEVEVLLRAYTTLATLHVPPSDPKRLAEAAVRALPRGEAPVPTFTPDAQTNSGLLEQYTRTVFSEQKHGNTLLWEAVRAMITATEDAHTMLISPEQLKAAEPDEDGLPSVYFGAAIGFFPDGRYIVIDVDPSSPTGKAGLKPGDEVLAIDGREAATLRAFDFLFPWRNGTAVMWNVRRPGRNDPVELKVAPFLWLDPIVESRMLEDSVGYVCLKVFLDTKDPLTDSASLVRARLEQLAQAGARSFVFDLRGNGGGMGVEKVFSIFSDGEPVLLIRDRNGKDEMWHREGQTGTGSLPVVLLIDSGTFSAAEMTAYAIQQYKSALIMGSPTGGGLSIPEDIELSDGYVLHYSGKAVVGPVSHSVPSSQRVIPDVVLPERTPEELARGVDRVLSEAVVKAKDLHRHRQ
jgi:carboxyl-terminal processing protease